MRISTLIILSLLISSTLFSQEKGDLLIGGSLGFGSYKSINMDVTDKNSTFYVSPAIGKFYRNNRLAGVSLSYRHTIFNDDDPKSNTYGVGFFLRQYQPLGKSFYLFAEEEISGSSSKYNYYPNADKTILAKQKEKYLSANFSPGLVYAINKKLHLEIELARLVSFSYSNRSTAFEGENAPSENSLETFGLSTGFSETGFGNLAFGIRWLIGK